MMRIDVDQRSQLFSVLLLVCTALFLSACDSGSSPLPPISMDGIHLDQTSVRLDEGGTARLRVMVGTGSSARELGNAQAVWSVADPTILSVTGGVLTGLRPGRTSVAVTVSGKHTASANVEVVGAPGDLRVIVGDQQTGTVGMTLGEPVRVRLLDRRGEPMAGREILFTPVHGAGSVSASRVTVDAEGVAETSWTLGTVSGDQALDIRVADRPAVNVAALAKAAPGPLARIEISPSTVVTNPGRTIRYSATPRDAYGNIVPDVRIDWASTDASVARVSGDGRIEAMTYGEAEIEAVAHADGLQGGDIAMAPPPDRGRGRFLVKDDAVPAQVTDLAVIGMSSSTISLAFTEVSDGYDGPADYLVRYSRTPISDTVTATVQQGSCTSPLAGSAIGNRRVCTAEGLLPGTSYDFQVVTFKEKDGKTAYGPLSNIAGGKTSSAAMPSHLGIASGNNQTAAAGAALAAPLVARVTDQSGNPVAGVAVSWAIVSGGGTLNTTQSLTNTSGLAQVYWTLGGAAGSQSVRASSGQLTSVTFTATAEAGALASITVSPDSTALTQGSSLQLQAKGVDRYGNTVSGLTFAWSSDDPTRATVSSSGVVSGVSSGKTRIRASLSAMEGQSTISVAEPASLQKPGRVVDLAVDSIGDGMVRLRFTEVDDGSGKPARVHVRFHVAPMGWNWGVASSPGGGTCRDVVEGVQVGGIRKCTIDGLGAGTTYDFRLVSYRGTLNEDAVFGDLSNVAQATTLAGSGGGTLDITPNGGSLQAITETLQLTATARDASGAIVSSPGVSWSSSDTNIATVDANGMVTARGVGTVLITAAAACCGGDQVTVVVSQKVAAVAVDPASTSVKKGSVVRLAATARDARGYTVSNTSFSWSSSNPAVATVDNSGNVTALDDGSVSITAHASGHSATASVTVPQESDGGTPGSPANWPSEPGDFTLLHETGWETGTDGWYGFTDTRERIGDLPSSPLGERRGVEMLYPLGMQGGAGNVIFLSNETLARDNDLRSLYMAFWVMLDHKWQGHASGANKLAFVNFRHPAITSGGADQGRVWVEAWGADQNTLRPAIVEQGHDAKCTARLTTGSGEIVRGRWHLMEVIVDLASTINAMDGRVRVYLDGNLSLDRTGVCTPGYLDSGSWLAEPAIAAMWGGVGDTMENPDQRAWYDRVRVSGR